MPSGTVIVLPESVAPSQQVAIYVRVSSAENRANLETQAERVTAYCVARGYQIHQIIKEVGSGINDNRPKFLDVLANKNVTVIVVEHKDRATRFGFRYIDTLLTQQGRRIEVVNLADNGKEDLIADMVAIVYSFAARLYGQRRAKRKVTAIQAVLESEDQDATGGATSD